jgi:hypothetical protein
LIISNANILFYLGAVFASIGLLLSVYASTCCNTNDDVCKTIVQESFILSSLESNNDIYSNNNNTTTTNNNNINYEIELNAMD